MKKIKINFSSKRNLLIIYNINYFFALYNSFVDFLMGYRTEFVWNFHRANFDPIGTIHTDPFALSIFFRIAEAAKIQLNIYFRKSLVWALIFAISACILVALAMYFISVYFLAAVLPVTVCLGPIFTVFARYNARGACRMAEGKLKDIKADYERVHQEILGYYFTYKLDPSSVTHMCVLTFDKPETHVEIEVELDMRHLFDRRKDEVEAERKASEGIVRLKVDNGREISFMEMYKAAIEEEEMREIKVMTRLKSIEKMRQSDQI